MNPEVLVGPQAELARALVDVLTPLARQARENRRPFALALPGGSAAEAFLPALSIASAAWGPVDFLWGDERAVPPDHPDSNYALARRLWPDLLVIGEGRVHRMPGETSDLDAAATAYAQELTDLLGSAPTIDVVLLGVGPDGHVCSLFPGHAALQERSRLVVAVTDSPKPPPRRLTLTLPVLCASRLVCVAAFGDAKAKVVREAIEMPDSPLPVAQVARGAARVVFLLDPAAAGRCS